MLTAPSTAPPAAFSTPSVTAFPANFSFSPANNLSFTQAPKPSFIFANPILAPNPASFRVNAPATTFSTGPHLMFLKAPLNVSLTAPATLPHFIFFTAVTMNSHTPLMPFPIVAPISLKSVFFIKLFIVVANAVATVFHLKVLKKVFNPNTAVFKASAIVFPTVLHRSFFPKKPFKKVATDFATFFVEALILLHLILSRAVFIFPATIEPISVKSPVLKAFFNFLAKAFTFLSTLEESIFTSGVIATSALMPVLAPLPLPLPELELLPLDFSLSLLILSKPIKERDAFAAFFVAFASLSAAPDAAFRFSSASAAPAAVAFICDSLLLEDFPVKNSVNALNFAAKTDNFAITVFITFKTGANKLINPCPIVAFRDSKFNCRILTWFAHWSDVFAKSPCAAESCPVTNASLNSTFSCSDMALVTLP